LVLFVRIGTFQWVTVIPNKIFSPSPSRPNSGAGRSSIGNRDMVAQLPVFTKELSLFRSRARSPE
jgi:hypothetical protein